MSVINARTLARAHRHQAESRDEEILNSAGCRAAVGHGLVAGQGHIVWRKRMLAVLPLVPGAETLITLVAKGSCPSVSHKNTFLFFFSPQI